MNILQLTIALLIVKYDRKVVKALYLFFPHMEFSEEAVGK